MPLTSAIASYDTAWPEQFEIEAERLRPVFKSALLNLHHIGSTAVPGLSAKPEIDLLAIVDATNASDHWTRLLVDHGYRRGGDLSAGHLFYKRDIGGVRTHKLHVCLDGHAMAQQMLRFCDLLRENDEHRHAYEALKYRLQAENTRGIGEYLQAKAPFIRAVLANGRPSITTLR